MYMDYSRLELIRRHFKLKIHESDGVIFQNLVEDILSKKYKYNFVSVRPYGKLGDMKNDGFISSEKIYFQIYGPENLSKSLNNAITKAKIDINGLLTMWKDAETIIYLVNDKYLSVNAPDHLHAQKLYDEIEKINSGNIKEIKLWGARELENLFFELSVEEQFQILSFNYLALDATYNDLNFDILNDIAEYILNLTKPKSIDTKLIVPNYDDKIIMNNFDELISRRLKDAHLNHSDLERFFNGNSDISKKIILDKIHEVYEESRIKYTHGNNTDFNSVYLDLIDNLTNNKKYGYVIACESLISYFFETCDIFLEPEVTL